MRKPREIAADIMKEHARHLLSGKVKPGKMPGWLTFSRPYLEAMRTLESVEDRYCFDSGYEICLRASCNLTNWRGDRAKELKAELKALLESCPRDKHI